MSLVGSLEDLGLGDILQIVSLSRKSGVLALRSEAGDGRIVLADGLVRGAAIKGEPEDLRSLLVPRGEVSEQDFERAVGLVESRGLCLDEALAECADVDIETLQALRRDHVERAVIRMFQWRSGEFSFEVRDEIGSDEVLLVASGINTQYLAMEASRQRDESAHPMALPGPLSEEAPDETPMFSGEPETSDSAEAETSPVDALALATAYNIEAELPAAEAAAEEAPTAEFGIALEGEQPAPAEAFVVETVPEPPAVPSPAAPAHPAFAHLVVIDPNLAGLEWFKASIDGMFHRVHIFQRSDAGFERIRSYLGRGTLPLVVVSARAAGDPMTGVRSVAELIRRLRTLAPKIPILALEETGSPKPKLAGIRGVVYRPASPGLDPELWSRFDDAARRLREVMSDWAETPAPAAEAAGSGPTHEDLDQLRAISDRLRDPNTQGEVLTLVIEFAAACFSRVAMFMVRDESILGMAQRGMQKAGGSADEQLRGIEFARDACPELFKLVLERRAPLRSSMEHPTDRRLAVLLGTSVPRKAYAAPIESGGRVVALLYADNLPGEAPLADTAGLEIVLHEAGLALDRALLQRTLASARPGS